MKSDERAILSSSESTGTKTYLNLTEHVFDKRALEEAKIALTTAVEENCRLAKEREVTEKETYAVTELLRQELRDKTVAVQKLEEQIVEIRHKGDAKIADVRKSSRAEIDRIRSEANDREQHLKKQIEKLEKEIQRTQEFRERQEEIEQVVFTFQNDKKEIEERLNAEKNNLEHNFVEEIRRLKKDYEQRLEKQRITAQDTFDQSLDHRVKQILSENRRLAVELSLHTAETDVLQREVTKLERERLRLTEEVQYRRDLEDGFARRGAEQGIRLKAAQSRSNHLEQNLKQVLIESSNQKQDTERRFKRQIADAMLEISALKNLVMVKAKENATLRAAAQDVLLQRNDVERFLVSSIHIVRKEMMNNDEQGNEGEWNPSIESMSWADREKVLKVLLSKLNRRRKPSSSIEPELNGQISNEGPVQPT